MLNILQHGTFRLNFRYLKVFLVALVCPVRFNVSTGNRSECLLLFWALGFNLWKLHLSLLKKGKATWRPQSCLLEKSMLRKEGKSIRAIGFSQQSDSERPEQERNHTCTNNQTWNRLTKENKSSWWLNLITDVKAQNSSAVNKSAVGLSVMSPTTSTGQDSKQTSRAKNIEARTLDQQTTDQQ